MSAFTSRWPKNPWRNPHWGGSIIPPQLQARTERKILNHARLRYATVFKSVTVTFRRQFCYVEARLIYRKPAQYLLRYYVETLDEYRHRIRTQPQKICRLRYFADIDVWTYAVWVDHLSRWEGIILSSLSPCGSARACFNAVARRMTNEV